MTKGGFFGRPIATFSVLVVFAAGVTYAAERPEIRFVTGPFAEGGLERPDHSAADVGDWAKLTVIEETLSVTERNGIISVVGEVRNDSENAIGLETLDFAGLDADGGLVAADSYWNGVYGIRFTDSIGISREVLTPGGTGIFRVSLFPLGQPVETILISVSGREAEIEPTVLPLEMVDGWEIEEWYPGLTRFTGIVRNVGPTDIIGLTITVGARSQTGKMVLAQRIYPVGERIGGYLGGIRAGAEIDVEFYVYVDLEEIAADSVETRLAGRLYEGGWFDYGLAGVAHLPGAEGTTWRSSLGLTNRSGAAGGVALAYYHSGGRAAAELVLADGEAVDFDDVVQSLFGVGGASAGYVQIRSTVPLTVSGRTANETPDGGFGQALPVYTRAMTFDISIGLPGVLSTLRGGPQFRTNIGLVNMADAECTARVQLLDQTGAVVSDPGQIHLGPTEWRQLNNAVPASVEGAYATVEPQGGCPIWAYASVIENATGDPTTLLLVPGTEIDLAPWRARGFGAGHPWADMEPPPVP